MIESILLALAVSFFLGFPTRALLLRAGVIDRPNERSSHTVPTVRGGGIGFIAVIVLALALFSASEPRFGYLALATTMLAIVGFIDDRSSLGIAPRLGSHLLAALVPASFLVDLAEPISLALALIAVVGTIVLTNAMNFMDGINGIATTHGTIGFFATAIIALLSGSNASMPIALVALSGATLGFLPWNFPNARMFMGDVASAPLGYLLASTMVMTIDEGGLSLLPSFTLLHLGFVLDTTITVLRRRKNGEDITAAHREHFYQRLVRSGLSHRRVTLSYTALTTLGAGVAIALPSLSFAMALCASLLVLCGWLALFAYAERRFRRAQTTLGISA